MAEYGKAFGMDVIYFDPYVEEKSFEHTKTLDELAKRSDIVSIHVKLNDETENLIGSSFFQAMKKTAVFINTSRGGIVEDMALLDALKSGGIAGCLLYTSPSPRDKRQSRMPSSA